ncbi:hypothetical protein [uncultured Methylobacterium sp.]|uniref:hypothetical protein n=1 Tax=uncultured Methylobacterium sp. TaxID=157278 RepID=UPI0035CB6168
MAAAAEPAARTVAAERSSTQDKPLKKKRNFNVRHGRAQEAYNPVDPVNQF